MFKILTLNNISVSGLRRLPRERYEVASEIQHPDGILVRSFNMHEMEIPPTLKAVGRAGAGVNNIPVDKMSARGIVVFNAPGANSNAVKELVIAGMLLAARNIDIVMVDTAGRLHTRFNLMEELKKVYRVVGKALPGAPHAVWLVLDATTGQNALHQARAFKDAVAVTGVILSKLDSSARGGMAFAIQRELNLPILFAGLGEKPEDLTPFDPDAFVEGILG